MFTTMSTLYKVLFVVALAFQVHHMQSSTSLLTSDLSVMVVAIATIAFVCQHMLGSKIIKEDVTIIQDFGIQMYSYNLSGKVCSSRFVDLARVRDVILNESMSYWQLD